MKALLAACVVLSGCMTAAQRIDRREAREAIAAARAAVAEARSAGAATASSTLLAQAEEDLDSALRFEAQKDWPAAARRARIARETAVEAAALARVPKRKPSGGVPRPIRTPKKEARP